MLIVPFHQYHVIDGALAVVVVAFVVHGEVHDMGVVYAPVSDQHRGRAASVEVQCTAGIEMPDKHPGQFLRGHSR